MPKTQDIVHKTCISNIKEFFLFKKRLLLILCSFLFFSCSSTREFNTIDNNAFSGNFSQAQTHLEENKESLYLKTDQVLYNLDSGMLFHFEGNYAESNMRLSQAERLIEDYYAVSITQSIGSYMLNDNIIDYAGEDFEDIYTNLFMSINYIQLGETDSAFVEIRRFNNKLQLLSQKYSQALVEARNQVALQGYNAEGLLPQGIENQTIEFYDSAFARYVSMLLYRSQGNLDSAQIDKKFIETAFATQSQLYPFPVPEAVDEELNIPRNKERLNFFTYTGLAPEKEEEIIRLSGLVGGSWFKLALPIMKKKPSIVSSITVHATDENGNVFTDNLEIIESIENIATDTFQQRQGLIYLKTLVRSISKTAVNSTITSAIYQSEASSLALLYNLAADVFIEVSETADLRSSRYFPANVWVGGINLDTGTYTVQVTGFDSFNNIVYDTITENVEVKANKVNLVESVCLQ